MLQVNISFKKLAVQLLPLWLRQGNVLLIVQAATWPLRQQYNDFVAFLKETIYKLEHNGQVCYLRAVLNDKLDITDRRILLVDFDGLQRIYFWPAADIRDVNFETGINLWPDNQYADSGVDFTIKIPYSIVNSIPEIAYLKSLANEYKVAGKNYNIVKY